MLLNSKQILLCTLIVGIPLTKGYSQDLNSALMLTNSERFEDADAVYKALLEKQPNNGTVYFYYGNNIIENYLSDPFSLSINEVSEKVSSIFKTGIEKDSLNPLNYIGMGKIILLQKSDTLASNKYFNKAESTIPTKKKKITNEHITILIQLAEAQILGNNKRYEKAIAYLNKAKEYQPDNTDIYIALGDIYIDRNDASNAIVNYNRAVNLNPKLPSPFVKIGNIYTAARNPNEARTYFEKAIEIDSTYAPVYKGLGEMYSMAGLYKFSKDNYKKFLDLSGNNIPAKTSYVNSLYKAKDYNDVLSLIDEILAVDNSRNYLNRIAAYSCYDSKPPDYERGLKYIENFFKNAQPDKIITKDYVYYGKILLMLKQDSLQIDKGFTQLIKAYNMDTTDYDLLNEIAVNAYIFKRYNIAANMYSRKAALNKATTNDYIYFGKSYYQMGQYEKAVTVFTGITKREPHNVQAYLWIANTYANMDPDSKLGLARPWYDTVIVKAVLDTSKNLKELFEAYSYLGSYFLFVKPDYELSKTYYQNIIGLDPNNKSWIIKGYTSLGIISTKKKEYALAKKYYSKVLDLDPNNKGAQQALKQVNDALIMQQYQ